MLSFVFAALKNILTAMIGIGGEFETVTVHLYKNDYTPSIGTVIGDLIEADFDGYAASSAVTWGAVVQSSDGTPLVIGDTKTAVATGSTTPNTVYGYYYTDSGGNLKGAAKFDEPVQIVDVDDFVSVVPVLNLS